MDLKILENCNICPHNCNVNRLNNKIGWCKSKDTVKVAKFSTHNFEEPCISGKDERLYIQSAYALPSKEKMDQEQSFFQTVI